MASNHRSFKPSPVSGCSISSPLSTPHHRGNDIKSRRAYMLPRARCDNIPESISSPTYADWERAVVDTMVLDDDHYYIESEAEPESGTPKIEAKFDEMEMDTEFGMDADMVSIKKHLQRIRISTPVPRPEFPSAYRPVSLSKKLGASHIAGTTTLEIIMEEDEKDQGEDSMAMDMNSTYQQRPDSPVINPTAMDIISEENISIDADMGSAHVPTTPITTRFVEAKLDLSSSPVKTYYSMLKQIRQAQELSQNSSQHASEQSQQQQQMKFTPVRAQDHLIMSISSNDGDSFMSGDSSPMPSSPGLVSSTGKRNRHITDDGEGERRAATMTGGHTVKRTKTTA